MLEDLNEWAENDPVAWCESLLRRSDSLFSGDESECQEYFKAKGLQLRAEGLALAITGGSQCARKTWRRWRQVQFMWEEVERSSETSGGVVEIVKLDSEVSVKELRRQISVDVDRAGAFFDLHENIEAEDRLKLRERLAKILELTIDCGRSSRDEEGIELQYLQGAHELCLVLMEMAGNEVEDEDIVEMCKSVMMTRVFVLHSGLSLAIAVHMILTQVSLLLKQFAPE